MKIAVVAPTYIPARRANTIQVMKMAQALVDTGHDVRLLVPGDVEDAPRPSWEELSRHYGLRRATPMEWLTARPSWKRYDFGWRAVEWARHWGAQVLYTRLPQAAFISSLLGLATIYEVHDLPQGRLGPFLFRWFLSGSGARRLVVITQALLDDLVQRFGAPEVYPFTVLAADGVDLERYAQIPKPEQARRDLQAKDGVYLPPRQFTAGYSGHLYPGRGARFILDLAPRLSEVTFMIVGGEPPEVERLREEATARGLDNFVLTGFVPNAELPRYQAACDVLMLPYRGRVAASSGGDISPYLSPMKLFEYMACGRVILSTDLPVLREVLNPGNALLLPPDDLDAWIEAFLYMRDHPERRTRLAQQARRDAQGYSWEERAQKILDGIF